MIDTNLPLGANTNAIIGLLGTVLGAGLASLSAWLTNRAATARFELQIAHERRERRSQLAKEKLEELFMLLGHWTQGFFDRFTQLTLVMKGYSDYNQYLDLVAGSKAKCDFNRLEMLMGIYGDSVKEQYNQVLHVREQQNDLMAAHKAAYERGEDGRKFLQPYTNLQLQLNEQCELLRAQVARAARDT